MEITQEMLNKESIKEGMDSKLALYILSLVKIKCYLWSFRESWTKEISKKFGMMPDMSISENHTHAHFYFIQERFLWYADDRCSAEIREQSKFDSEGISYDDQYIIEFNLVDEADYKLLNILVEAASPKLTKVLDWDLKRISKKKFNIGCQTIRLKFIDELQALATEGVDIEIRKGAPINSSFLPRLKARVLDKEIIAED